MSWSRGTRPAQAGGQDPKRMRPGLVGAAGSEPASRTQGDVLSGGGTKKGSSSAPAVVRDLTVDERLLECNICYLPLKPPIFQCGVGHVLCSTCYTKKLKDALKCHLCGVAMPGGYQRCHAMEDMMNSIRGPCPHAPYGCDATPVYHAREEHIVECPHAPCHCPGDRCSFMSSVGALIEHLAAAHSWPCTAEARSGDFFVVKLRNGFNFLTAVRRNAKYLFLLNMGSTQLRYDISAVRIGSLAAMAGNSMARATCNLTLEFSKYNGTKRVHQQSSNFQLECTCPSNGLPDPYASFQFSVPRKSGSNATVEVVATIPISSLS